MDARLPTSNSFLEFKGRAPVFIFQRPPVKHSYNVPQQKHTALTEDENNCKIEMELATPLHSPGPQATLMRAISSIAGFAPTNLVCHQRVFYFSPSRCF